MGTPVEEGEKGADCNFCTPEIWEPGHTPKYLLMMVSGMIRGVIWHPGIPEPPNGEHILTQHATNPCQWLRLDPFFKYFYTITATDTFFDILNPVGMPVFVGRQADPCWEYFTNLVTLIDFLEYAEGSGFVDLYDFPGTAYQLLHDYSLAPTDYTRFDVFHCEGEKPYIQVRRFGNVRTPTNIKIKTDATHKDQFEMFEA